MINEKDKIDNEVENDKQDLEGINKISKRKAFSMINTILVVGVISLTIVSVSLLREVSAVKEMLTENRSSRGELSNIVELMEEIKSIYDNNYIGEMPDKEEIEDMALFGYSIGFADRYGNYSGPERTEELTNTRQEKLVGIGIDAVLEDKGYYISNVYNNSPAEKAGLKKGDYIVSAGNIEVKEETAQETLANIRGEEGTIASLEILEGGNIKKKIDIQRENVVTHSVQSRLIENTVYMRISKFTDLTDEEFIAEINKHKQEGKEKFIVDLRNNTGGTADSVIKMLDYILPEGLLVRFESKEMEDDLSYYSDSKEVRGEFVILVNQSTASASELFSKVMQDYNRATVVGTQTFGKGTVLSTYALSNGGSLTLSTAKYYTQSGDELEGIGVKPDIELELAEDKEKILYKLSDEEDIQLQKAIELLK